MLSSAAISSSGVASALEPNSGGGFGIRALVAPDLRKRRPTGAPYLPAAVPGPRPGALRLKEAYRDRVAPDHSIYGQSLSLHQGGAPTPASRTPLGARQTLVSGHLMTPPSLCLRQSAMDNAGLHLIKRMRFAASKDIHDEEIEIDGQQPRGPFLGPRPQASQGPSGSSP